MAFFKDGLIKKGGFGSIENKAYFVFNCLIKKDGNIFIDKNGLFIDFTLT